LSSFCSKLLAGVRGDMWLGSEGSVEEKVRVNVQEPSWFREERV
jgi:hypothetical protein